jgi:hypothetical protein
MRVVRHGDDDMVLSMQQIPHTGLTHIGYLSGLLPDLSAQIT